MLQWLSGKTRQITNTAKISQTLLKLAKRGLGLLYYFIFSHLQCVSTQSLFRKCTQKQGNFIQELLYFNRRSVILT